MLYTAFVVSSSALRRRGYSIGYRRSTHDYVIWMVDARDGWMVIARDELFVCLGHMAIVCVSVLVFGIRCLH